MKGFALGSLLSAIVVIALVVLVAFSILAPMGCVNARRRVEYYAACERSPVCRLEASQAYVQAEARARVAECSSSPDQRTGETR